MHEDFASYANARKLLTFIASFINDPELKTFIDAYFEHRRVKEGAVQKPEAWARLVAVCNAALGRNFLNRLERLIQKFSQGNWRQGVKYVVSAVGENPSKENFLHTLDFLELTEAPDEDGDGLDDSIEVGLEDII